MININTRTTEKKTNVNTNTKLVDLSNEILDIIIDFALRGSNRPVINTFDALSCLGNRFKQLTVHYIHRLPRVHINKDIYAGYHSMRKICKEFGRGSGLVIALREIIDSSQWINAWVKLLFTGFMDVCKERYMDKRQDIE